MRPKGYTDLADLPEDDRITVIGEYVMRTRETAGVPVDDEPGKPGRYIAKLEARFPGVRCVIKPGMVAKTVTIIVRPPVTSAN